MTVKLHGTFYAKVLSRSNRWGGPKVHYARWFSSTGGWEPVCMPQPRNVSIGSGYHVVDDSEPATCKHCLAWRDRHR